MYDNWKLQASPEGKINFTYEDKPKNEQKTTTFIKAKHMINNATEKTIGTAANFVLLYNVLASETKQDKEIINALLKAKQNGLQVLRNFVR